MSLAATTATDLQPSPVPRRPRANKSPRATSPQVEPKAKVSFYLSDQAIRRLGIASVMDDTSQSAIVERLVMENLRRWVVSDRAKTAGEAMVEGSAN